MDNNARTVTLETARDFLKNNPEGVLLNVLTHEDFERRRIPGSKNACVFQTSFPAQVRAAVKDTGTQILVYGAGNSLDAETARENLADEGYHDVLVFAGGLDEWREAGLPLEGTDPSLEPPAFPPQRPLHPKYRLVPGESSIRWAGRNDNGGHWGYVPLKEGRIRFLDGVGQGEATADMTAISCHDLTPASGVMELLFHLASRDFFHTKKYPEATVKVASLQPVDGAAASLPNYYARGAFAIKGKEHAVEGPLAVRNLPDGRLSIAGRINLDRTIWGVLYGSARFFRFLGMHKVDDLIDLEAFIMLEPEL